MSKHVTGSGSLAGVVLAAAFLSFSGLLEPFNEICNSTIDFGLL